MTRKLIPFYTHHEKGRLGHTLYLDAKSLNIYRIYTKDVNPFSSMKYWIYYWAASAILSQLEGINIFINFTISLLILLIVGVGCFFMGYAYLYNKSIAQSDLKEAFLMKEDLIYYAKEGRKNFIVLVVLLVITLLILCLTISYFLEMKSILPLMIISFLFFIVGVLMRCTTIKRLKLHMNGAYLRKVVNKLYEHPVS